NIAAAACALSLASLLQLSGFVIDCWARGVRVRNYTTCTCYLAVFFTSAVFVYSQDFAT
ncbi:unnamed protein product, partial [Amoebophrya sp. A25]